MLPTLTVKLDNGTGTYPYDVTTKVLSGNGYTISRGRGDWQDAITAGQLDISLDNSDGRFTQGSGTYGIDTDQGIRILENGAARFTGRIQSWSVSWPQTPGNAVSFVQVAAVDDLARAARRTLLPAVVEDILVNDPMALYQLSEAAGATQAGDSSGSGLPSLSIAGTGTALTFGSGIGPTDGLTCATFAGGTFLQGSGAEFIAAGSAWTVECFFATTQTPATGAPFLYVDGGTAGEDIGLFINSSGHLQGSSATTSLTTAGAVNDGLVHHAALTLTAGGALTLYLDGSSAGSSAGQPLLSSATTRFSVAPSQGLVFTTPYTGSVAHAAVFPTALSSTVIGTRASATNDYAGETPSARLARVAGYMALPTGSLDTAGSTTLGPASQMGRSALDVIDETARATLGVAFLDGSGALTSVNGYSITQLGFPNAIVPASNVTPEISVLVDMFGIVNYATGKATGSENVFGPVADLASITKHGQYPQSYEWNVATDNQAVDRTNWMVRTFSQSYPRCPTLSINLLRDEMLSGTRTACLGLDLGDFVSVTGMPSPTTPGGNLFLIIDGISETVSATEWTLTINGSRHAQSAAWILGDGFFGVLNASTKLYV